MKEVLKSSSSTGATGSRFDARSGQPARSRRIFCVDDDALGMRARGMLLTAEGYQVTVEVSPVQALTKPLLDFDLAILDYEMPELDGVQLVRAMRARGVRYPVVLLSGRASDLQQDERSLFSDCLDKGLPVKDLLRTIRHLLYGVADGIL